MLTTKTRNIVLLAAAAILIAADQTAKYLVYSKGFGGFLMRLRPVLSLLIFPNHDFAFSLKLPMVLIYAVDAILLALLLVWFYRLKAKTTLLWIGLMLILAGALSNIGDRIYFGYVRDFIYIFWGNIFNLADLYILAGIILLIVN